MHENVLGYRKRQRMQGHKIIRPETRAGSGKFLKVRSSECAKITFQCDAYVSIH